MNWTAVRVPLLALPFTLSSAAQPLLAAAEAGSPPPIDLWSEAVQVAGYLLILLVLALLVVHLGRRFQPGLGGNGPIRIEDGRNLAPGVGVRLIRVGARAWLVGVTKDRISLLAEMKANEMTLPDTSPIAKTEPERIPPGGSRR